MYNICKQTIRNFENQNFAFVDFWLKKDPAHRPELIFTWKGFSLKLSLYFLTYFFNSVNLQSGAS